MNFPPLLTRLLLESHVDLHGLIFLVLLLILKELVEIPPVVLAGVSLRFERALRHFLVLVVLF